MLHREKKVSKEIMENTDKTKLWEYIKKIARQGNKTSQPTNL